MRVESNSIQEPVGVIEYSRLDIAAINGENPGAIVND